MENIKKEEILKLAEKYKPEMSKFLRDMARIPSESCDEKDVILRIKEEMEKVGFDKVEIDPMGNVLGYIGHGKHVIAMDAHIDTVGIGDRNLWNYDPYEGYEDDEIIIGRGVTDQEGGMASMVYAGKIIKDLGLEDDYTLIVTGTVQEEDCDGLCWQYIVNEDKIKPEFVVITEPTSLNIYRGHRGRMEIKVTTHGISCHGSAPERGDNAIFKMAPILNELKALNENLKDDEFLGKGTLTVSEIFFSSPSRCAVADGCTISVDRRLTDGETWEYAIQQIKNLPSVKAAKAEVEMYSYERPSYTDLVYPTECFFPTWVLKEDHPICETAVKCYKDLFRSEPKVDKWTFSTNAVSIMGRYGIPCIGFGPGHEDQAHAPNERTWKEELVKAAAMYALIPITYVKEFVNK
ncbi:YgeY family selenium metabolism-linked hydrolase [Clostridium botulinum]|uniref:YgeY family selenium metabolism-linked hydrolase n=1 Tax=Clostridium botulinum TaxID=1491 RepID=UPI0001F84C12|nr:YgeY family selenium metabolism-linked hydrolase [Clostridium botulinum]NFB18582.1 YgeY family selenium metabolism-linked hydrolase [Clostridium botulinum]NFB67636.1 YgeY family selenium metabolism-linked hydrolase [Clostridium botulinum]NFB97135.1 YgeY family selenium metabolism-linked hydrolase [Clostridium botulinum]NFC48001.1 YgeY family selenium metabolism-linked hydrolase [Clostridium botulinum]NFC58297.1 YgeY family selenium metabolism-linked hydrolase [Clostridium botulinum]